MAYDFTDAERRILRIVQADLPDTLTPFADIARQAGPGVTEEQVLTLLKKLRDEGAIRRFGCSLRHQNAGWASNFMVAWVVPADRVSELGALIRDNPNVSHCYYRPSSVEDWPYEFYTMVHGRSDEECNNVVENLKQTFGLDRFAILKSTRELKKISPTYF